MENIAGELDRCVGDEELAGRNWVDSGVVGDFEAWTRVGTGVGRVIAKVMGIASTNEDVGGATIGSEGEFVAEDGENSVVVVGVGVRGRRGKGVVVGERSSWVMEVGSCSWVVGVGSCSWMSCSWGWVGWSGSWSWVSWSWLRCSWRVDCSALRSPLGDG